jgi:hypothetical protein
VTYSVSMDAGAGPAAGRGGGGGGDGPRRLGGECGECEVAREAERGTGTRGRTDLFGPSPRVGCILPR